MSLRMLRRVVLAGPLLCAAAVFPEAAADHYKVSFERVRADDDGALRLARVEASLTPVDGKIKLVRAAADSGLYHGWAGFVTEMAASDARGRPLPTTYEGQGVWRLQSNAPGPVTVRYAVALQHDRFRNEPGDDELAVARGYGVMWTARALFLEGGPSKDVVVEFALPPGWKISTPWRRLSGTGWVFRPEDTDDLLDAAFLAGGHEEFSFPMGKARAVIALGPPVRAFGATFRPLMQSYFAAYERLLRATPDDNFLLIGMDASFLGGGVIGRTISLSLNKDAEGAQGRAVMGHLIAHEGFHLWNVRWAPAGAPPELEWFAEGTAEYYALLTGRRLGLIDDASFLARLSDHVDLYRRALGSGQAIAGAGTTKNASEASYNLVYSGGVTALLLADLDIRRATQGRRSLDDVVRAVHAEYAGGSTGVLSLAALAALTKRETGYDLSGLIVRHIRGAAPMDLSRALEPVGLQGNGPIARARSPSSAQRAAFAAWTRRAP